MDRPSTSAAGQRRINEHSRGKISRRLLRLLLISGFGIAALSACDDLITEVRQEVIAGNPDANFVVDTGYTDSGCVPLTVRFLDKSDGPRDTWLWKFGDGDSSTDTNPTHVYDSAGTYTVLLKITDSETGGVDTEVKRRFIIVGTSVTGFTYDTGQICRKDTISFVPVTGAVSSWSWNFGDGSALSTDSLATHVYDSSGTYEVTLTVNGTCGADSAKDSVTISNCPNAAFVIDPASATVGCDTLTVTFWDSSTVDSPEDIALRSWDFGDGTTFDTTGNSAMHQYVDTGTFTVKLTVTSTGGSVDTDSLVDVIRVYNSVSAGFTTLNATQACFSPVQQFAVKFQDTSLGNVISRVWDFGDGTIDNSNTPDPWHAFDTGHYDVKLTVVAVCGADTTTDSVTQSDLVILSPGALVAGSLTAVPDPSDTTGLTYFLGDGTPGDVVSRTWDFGDGSVPDSATAIVTHTFPDSSGTVYWVITITDSNPCNQVVVTDSVQITRP